MRLAVLISAKLRLATVRQTDRQTNTDTRRQLSIRRDHSSRDKNHYYIDETA